MKCSTFLRLMPAILLGIVMGVFTTPVFAVDGTPPGLFELDGNPQDSNGAGLPDDWDWLYDNCASDGSCPGGVPFEFTGIIADPAPVSIFTTGGSKDIYDISSWKHKDGAVPDKDDITNAFAAAYVNLTDVCYSSSGYDPECDDSGTELVHSANDQLIYFGFDRYDNSGDAFGGFWFLINDVDLDANTPGTFDNIHVAKTETTRGDILILVEYPQASGAIPVIKAYEWDPDLTGPPNLDEDGKSIGPLEMIYNSKDALNTALCDGTGDKLACAITNDEEVPTPLWDYTPKGGLLHDPLPHETFYSGGINLTKLLGGQNICVSTFLAETRSSRSETAQLKDFVRGGFSLCGAEITTTILDADGNEVGFPAYPDPENVPAIMAGTKIHDRATVTITGPGIEMDPEGWVDFELYDGKKCGLDDPENPVGPRASTLGVELVPGELGDNISTAVSAEFDLPAAACYSFHATFISDMDDFTGAVLDECEWVCIDKYPTKVETKIHEGTGHAGDIQGTAINVLTSVHDHAYVSVDGTFIGAPVPTGNVTFEIYGNATCEGSKLASYGGINWDQVDALDGSGEALTAVFTPPAGEFGIKAKYTGDLNYEAAADSACEPLTVNKLPPSILTKVKVHDLAQVSGSGGQPEGTVTFEWFSNDSCSGTPDGTDTIPLVAGAAESIASEQTLEVSAGTVSYLATYNGSVIYNPVIHDCELVVFTVPTP